MNPEQLDQGAGQEQALPAFLHYCSHHVIEADAAATGRSGGWTFYKR